MVTNDFAESAAEIDEILGYLPTEYIEKIPLKLRSFFNKVKKEEYASKIDPYKQLHEQKLKEKTNVILIILYRNYWCNEDERAELDKILINNEKKYEEYEEELREQHSIDNIFNKRKIIEDKVEMIQTNLPILEKKNLFAKVWEFIKRKIQ